MNKIKAKEHILECIEKDDELIGFFQAQSFFPIWWFLLLGPFGLLFLKTYFIAITKKGVNFHKLSLMGNFSDNGDFFTFDEIENVEIREGIIQRPMIFLLKNGIEVKIKALLKGVERAAKIDKMTQEHIEKNITTVT